jgi:hypothetical protein
MKGYVCSYTYVHTHTHTGIDASTRHMIVPHSGLGALDTLTGRPCATTLTIFDKRYILSCIYIWLCLSRSYSIGSIFSFLEKKINLTETSHRGVISRPSRALRLYDQRKIPLHLFYHWIPETGIFWNPMVKKVWWDFSLINIGHWGKGHGSLKTQALLSV